MSAKQKNRGTKRITRREFIKKAGMAGAAVGMTSALPHLTRRAFAAKRDHILIGHPNPSTGPLAGFGEASPWADERAIAAINAKGGIYIEEYGKQVPVKFKVLDTESDPTKAGELTSKLILQDKVDLMVVMHTPDTVNPVDAICERYEMPCISLDAPVEAWLTGGPYKWASGKIMQTKPVRSLGDSGPTTPMGRHGRRSSRISSLTRASRWWTQEGSLTSIRISAASSTCSKRKRWRSSPGQSLPRTGLQPGDSATGWA
jgi:hypothetical protein